MFSRRLLVSAGVAALLLIPSVPSLGASSETSSVLALVRSSSANGGCQGMDKIEASERFRHLDGSPSALSEWIPKVDVLVHKGPTVVRGKMPFGFYAVGKFLIPNRYYTLGGAKLIGRRFQIWCTPHAFVQVPPRNCPQTAEAAWSNLGGRKLKWQEGVVEPFTGVSSIVGYFVKNLRNSLRSFTVPHQSIVTRYTGDGQFMDYFPGEWVPKSRQIGIACYF